MHDHPGDRDGCDHRERAFEPLLIGRVIQQIAAERGLSQYVTFHSLTPARPSAAVYRDYDVLVYPVDDPAFDVVALEAASAGCVPLLAANSGKVAEYRAGKDKLFGFFVGQVMKATEGKANPQQVNELLKERLSGGA